ncbi:hypothetical protein VD0002_g5781 [Verticillium dahliae]|uniref:Uncharacterized protein n=1 Tax=Verticillium dahliae TaxID=27337 RepID=A0AA44WT71_VERDA|nr:hypothetical protein BJF96_g90 [Verticillium dahliae]PNH39234.1 hypothetical protein VD0004_g7651 [Verticillium dahliae]PNH49924.1 hypothetical protein VD0003_g7233 [Verticillium dahliae]PNH62200.1 hypothetical protein VD0002_g5781 [Verticillium dahliae]PNH62478.1 hypothetical protein VD0001_g9433 [Verticillium dahliae]
MDHSEVGMEAGQGQALAIVLWDFTMVEDPRKAVRVSEARVLLILRASTLEMAVPFFTLRGQCTCTRRPFQKSLAFLKAT